MRIENIEKDEKIRKVEDVQRELKVENTHLTEENHKLTKEINELTKKLLMRIDRKTKKYELERTKKEFRRKF